MKLYLIRHGQSETNLKKCFTGWAQVNLTEQGRADAISVRPMLKDIRFDKIYSSDLIRAMYTAELAIPGCEYETTPLLREVGMGSLELQPIAEVEADMLAKNTRELGYAMYGGESKAELQRRAKEFLQLVQSRDGQTVAAFSHWGLIGAVLDQVFGITLPKKKMVCKNCTVCILEYEKETWKLHSWINPSNDREESI